MSAPVSHKGYDIVQWPESTSPQLLYLWVEDRVTAAAASTGGGWLIFLYDSDTRHMGTNVGDLNNTLGWMDALGQAAIA